MTEIWIGAAKRLEDTDLPRIGHDIGVGEDELHAFLDVEAAGEGFDKQGRLKTLFEPHVFYRELKGTNDQWRAVAEGLAYPKWKPGAYPADSYPRIVRAIKINRTAALRSASWGLGQIMGFNHEAAGYKTVEDMIRDFAADEDNQVEAMVRFLKAKKLDDDLRAHRWNVIEEVYNGGGHGGAYARKMKERFAWWQKKPDTPWKPSKKYQGEDEIPKPQPVPPVVPPPPDIEPVPPAPPAAPPQPPGTSIAAVIVGAVLVAIATVASWVTGIFGGN